MGIHGDDAAFEAADSGPDQNADTIPIGDRRLQTGVCKRFV
jgi:hypothetical protein